MKAWMRSRFRQSRGRHHNRSNDVWSSLKMLNRYKWSNMLTRIVSYLIQTTMRQHTYTLPTSHNIAHGTLGKNMFFATCLGRWRIIWPMKTSRPSWTSQSERLAAFLQPISSKRCDISPVLRHLHEMRTSGRVKTERGWSNRTPFLICSRANDQTVQKPQDSTPSRQ